MHKYSIQSWSPNQSAPLTVSYICHLQSSSPILPNAAEMPPCAAEVWLLVGKTFDTHAVFNPASLRPTAALKPEPPAPNTTTSYS